MRVAAEAGISMNLVQYYFTSKDQMIHYGLERVIAVVGSYTAQEAVAFVDHRLDRPFS